MMPRDHSLKWILSRTRDLLDKSAKHNDGSLMLYAAFECRNMLEMLDFHLLWTGSDESIQKGLIDLAKEKRGIPKANSSYKGLNYKYQEFWAALTDTVNMPGGLKRYEYKKSGQLQEALGEYMHSYTKKTDDFKLDSPYMKEAKRLINDTVDFIEDFCLKKDHKGQDAIIYGGDKISSLPDKVRGIYEEWRTSSKMGEEAERELRTKLREALRNEPPINWEEAFKKN